MALTLAQGQGVTCVCVHPGNKFLHLMCLLHPLVAPCAPLLLVALQLPLTHFGCFLRLVKTDMGGSDAHLTVEQSCEALTELFVGLGKEKNGCFVNYDGAELPW